MSVVRQYEPTQFDIVGNVLKLKTGAAGDVFNTVNQTFTFAGGLHDYTADSNYVLTGYTGSGNGASWPSSALLGDGISVPYFYALNKGNYNLLQRTAGASLRIGPTNSIIGDPYPFGGNTSLCLIAPLSVLEEVTLDFVLSGNPGAGSGSGNKLWSYLGLGRLESSNTVSSLGSVGFFWDTTNSRISELFQGTTAPASHTGETNQAMDASFISGNVATRRYSISLNGPVLTILGAPTGTPLATPSVALWRKYDPTLLASRRDKFLYLSSGASLGTGGTLGAYTELQALTVTGRRALI